MESGKNCFGTDKETTLAFYRYMPKEKIEDLESERARLKKLKNIESSNLDESVIATLAKRGNLFLQYRKNLPLKLDPMEDTFHILNCIF